MNLIHFKVACNLKLKSCQWGASMWNRIFSGKLSQLFSFILFSFLIIGCQQKVQFGMKWELNSIGNEYFVHVNKSKKIEITGGMPPHTFKVYDDVNKVYTNKNSIGEIDVEGVFTAFSNSGVTQVQILDSKNNRHEVTINVAEPVQLLVDRTVIYSGESLQLNVRGGFGKIRYQLIGFGEISQANAYSSNLEEFGQVIIQVQDSMGFKEQKTVTVVRPLQVFPKVSQVIKGSKQKYSIEGGTPPFQVKIQPFDAATASSLLQVGGIHEFELSTQQATGQLTIEVSDSTAISQKATAQLELLNPLSVNTSNIQLAKGQTYSDLKVTGGFVGASGYTVTGCEGSIQISGQYSIKAGNQVTQCQLKISDSKNNNSFVNVSITENLSLSASNVTMVTNEIFDLSQAVSGGVPPFALVTSLTNSTYLQLMSGTQIKAKNVSPGIDLVLKDSQTGTPNQVTVRVIISDGLSLIPTQVTLAVGNVQDFSVMGGVGPYTYKVKSGIGTFDLATPNRYLGPNSQGTAVIEVKDSQGRLATANVTINQALSSSTIPTVNGNPLVELVNQSQHLKYNFQIQTSGGAGGNTYSSNATSVATVSNSGLIQAVGSGNAKITVTDSKNNKLEIPVTVYAPLVISPINQLIARTTENSSVTISGGKSSSYQAISNNALVSVSIINSNKLKIVASANTGNSVVTISDGLQQAILNVTNYGPIITNPSSLTLKVGSSTQFQISGGVPNYNVTFIKDLQNNDVATVSKTTQVTTSDVLTVTAKNKAGTFQFAVQDQMMSQNFNYQITADVPAQLSLSIAQSNVTSGACVQLTAGLVDQYQNLATISGDTNLNLTQTQLSVAANSQAAAGEFYSDANCQLKIISTFIPSGQAKLLFYYKASLAGQFGLSIQSPSFSQQTVNLTVQSASANRLAFIQLPNANSKETLATSIKIGVVDSSGNIVTNAAGTINLTKLTGPASGSILNTSGSLVNGITELNNLIFSTAGIYTINASISGGSTLSSITSSNITILENLYDVTLAPGQTEEPLKVVFIIDNSQTMSQSQANLSNGIANFLNNSQLANLNLEFYITTTNTSNMNAMSVLSKNTTNYINKSTNEITTDYNVAKQYPEGTLVEYQSESRHYFDNPTIKINKTDSQSVRDNLINNLKQQVLNVGTTGSDKEAGLLQILRTVASINYFSNIQTESAIKKNDKVLFVLISDEDEDFIAYPTDSNSNFTPFSKSERQTLQVMTQAGQDRYLYSVDFQYYKLKVNYKYLNDGVAVPSTGFYYFRPSSSQNLASGTSCTANQILQFYTNDVSLHLKSYFTNLAIEGSQTLESCTFEKEESSTYNWTVYSQSLSCADFLNGKNIYGNPMLEKSSSASNVGLVTRCSFYQTLFGDVSKYLGAYNNQPRTYSLNFVTDWANTYGQLSTQASQLQNTKSSYLAILKSELTKSFTDKGFYFAFIINPTSNVCNLQNGQSVGAYQSQFSLLLGQQSSIIPICQPDQYSSALTNAGLVMKTYMNGTFTISANNVNEIKYVDRIRGSTVTRLTKDLHYMVNDKTIQVNSDQLVPGDSVKIYWR